MRARPVVSVHFPKVGGTSLWTQFRTLLGPAFAIDGAHDPLLDSRRDALPWPAGARLVHGHFHPARHAAPGRRLVTFLRDPVENLVSIYFHWRHMPAFGHALHDRYLRERPSILDFARHDGLRHLMSEVYFGGFDMGRFDFIGFHETRRRDIARLGAMLDLPLSPDVHENRTAPDPERQEIEASPAIRAVLRGLLAGDIAFHEAMLKRRTRPAFSWPFARAAWWPTAVAAR